MEEAKVLKHQHSAVSTTQQERFLTLLKYNCNFSPMLLNQEADPTTFVINNKYMWPDNVF